MRKNKGSALVITLLVITILAGFAFAASRLTFSELNQSVRLEDSEISYQAAESGIELGLLLYRYNKNIQLPSDIDENNSFYRFNISDSMVESQDGELESDKSYFDLKIFNKNTDNIEDVGFVECDEDMQEGPVIYCVLDAIDGWISPALQEDHVVEYKVTSNDSIQISAETVSGGSGNLYIIPMSVNGEVLENKQIISTDELVGNGVKYDSRQADIIRLKAIGVDIKNYSISDNDGNLMDSRYTKMISIGYYGSTKRKLEVEIDNATGSLSTPFDFLIISD